MSGKDLLSVADLDFEEMTALIAETEEMKARGRSGVLGGKNLALLFEKPSLRTRVSFDVAMEQLGGHAVYLSPAEVGLGKRESVSDVARVLSRYVDGIAARTFSHQTVIDLADYADVPVINALSDLEHPCQALADFFTIYEKKGELNGLTMAYVGDGNNMAHSLMLAAALSGVNFRIASPAGYQVQESILQQARDLAQTTGSEIFLSEDPRLAVAGADAVYTDVWTSMGQEAESEKRRKVFAGYQVNRELVALAADGALLMHPLPAHHGEEVEKGILDGPQSVVFDQAENRLHVQKTILARLLGGLDTPLPRW